MSQVTIAIVYHSCFGHTEIQANAIAQGLQSIENTQVRIFTSNEACEKLDELDDVDGIVFGCPTYMGNISADMKKFLETASIKWSSHQWRNKIAGAFTTGMSYAGDQNNTLMGLVTNAMQHGMIYVGNTTQVGENQPHNLKHIEGPDSKAFNRMGSYLGVCASSFQLGAGQAPGEGDIATAVAYGARIAHITHGFKSSSL